MKECGNSFCGFSELSQHADTTHHALALEWCEECSQFVPQLLEHNNFQPVYHCDFMASGEGHLGRHVYVKHQKIAIVKCEECGKSLKVYKKHVRVFHDKLRIDSG